MATYQVADCTEPWLDMNGVYSEVGTYGGKTLYGFGTMMLFWMEDAQTWGLGTTPHPCYAESSGGNADGPESSRAAWSELFYNGRPTVTLVEGGPAGHKITGFVGNCTHNLPPGVAQSGTTVALTGDASDSMDTAGDGLFEFADLADGNYHLAASQAGHTFKPAAGQDVVVSGEDTGPWYFQAYTVGESGAQALIRQGFAWQFGGEH